MSVFDDAITPSTEDSIRATIKANAAAAGLKISNWRIVSVAVQILETVVASLLVYTNVRAKYVRGFTSLDLSTDPGDPDDFDPGNESAEPEPGLLSAFGLNTFFTEREDKSFATGFVTFTNSGPGSRTLSPQSVIFTQTGGTPPSPPPTYINVDDPTIYTGGFVTVAAGTSIVLPVVAQVIGAIGSAPAGTLSLTTSLTGCTATNENAILGQDREDADTYRSKCRQAPARLSFSGPADALVYFASKNLDGTPLLNTDGAPTSITRAQVTQNSTTGIANAYFASASGPAISEDVTAANTNIEQNAYVLFDCITYTGAAAISTVLHVQGTAKAKLRPGVTAQSVAIAIVASLNKNFSLAPVGGFDQDANGNGVFYQVDLEAWAHEGAKGLYDVDVTLPSGASTAIGFGHVAVLQSDPGDGLGSADWTITLVP